MFSLKDRTLALYKRTSRGLTADEVAYELGVSVLSVRPRVTELHNEGKLRPTGSQRRNLSGRWASVLAAI